ncbi:hypothetical protein EW026_g1970 [Hermanssonia centrifuga]|nr:hypothetical protein EW026_g1970 [Hermanssonia centrifuga]
MTSKAENRTTLRGVNSEDAESSSELVVRAAEATDDVEFFLLGSSLDILACNLVENGVIDTLLLLDRGVEGAVEPVSVDSDTFDSDGVAS